MAALSAAAATSPFASSNDQAAQARRRAPLPARHNRLIVAEVTEASAAELRLRHLDGQMTSLSFDYLLIGVGSEYT